MVQPTVDHDRIRDALDGMSARDLEGLREMIDRRLVTCLACGSDGAFRYRVTSHGLSASLPLCLGCFEKHRLPAKRSEMAGNDSETPEND